MRTVCFAAVLCLAGPAPACDPVSVQTYYPPPGGAYVQGVVGLPAPPLAYYSVPAVPLLQPLAFPYTIPPQGYYIPPQPAVAYYGLPTVSARVRVFGLVRYR